MKSVIIVGSGVAGTVVARQLLETGNDYKITMFEVGPDFEPGNHRKWLDYLMTNKWPFSDYMDGPREENERFGLQGSRLFVKGGTTNHWGGWSLRFKPEDFELKSRTGIGADWPITYDQLAPYYAKAETLLGIEGDSDNDDPPRYGSKFPFSPAPYTPNDVPMINALTELGMSYSHMPMARNGDRCITTGTCRYCPVNARYSAAFDLSQLQAEYGDKLELRTNSPVLNIDMNDRKQARGVSFLQTKNGLPGSIEADEVVVCSGTIESTKLLLASTSSHWSRGIGNDSGHVGRHLVGHPVVSASGTRPGNSAKVEQELGFITLASRHFDTPEHQKEGKSLMARVGDNSKTFLEREIMAGTSRSEIDAKMKSGMYFSLYASIEQFESPENRVSLGPGVDKWGLRNTQISFGVNRTTEKALHTHSEYLRTVLKTIGCVENSINISHGRPNGDHATSTCRMSGAEADGVVDRDIRVHGTDNLYVCSNAVFPNVTAVNPTLTVAALAVRLAEHIDRA